MKIAAASLLAAILVGVAAFAIPWRMFPDAGTNLDALELRMLRNGVRISSDVPPLRLQLRQLDLDERGEVAAAEFTWRTIFGVPYGTTRQAGAGTDFDWHLRRGFAAWAAFGAIELGLLGFAVRRANAHM